LPPWYTTDRAKLFRRLKGAPLDIPTYFSSQAANCVTVFLERNPRRRLGVTGIRSAMEHEFFRNISWQSLYARRVEAPIKPCEGWKAPDAVTGDGAVGRIGSNHGSPATFTDIDELNTHELEAATANFDNAFTRMPVESEDHGQEDNPDEAAAAEELDENTFIGFSFDSKDRDSASRPSSSSRMAYHQQQQQLHYPPQHPSSATPANHYPPIPPAHQQHPHPLE
jgi:hypothetical protein